MADPIEVKTLKDILQELKDTNIQYSRVKEQSEKLNEKFTPNVLRGMQNVELRNQIIGAQQDLARSVQALADKMKAGEAAATIAEGAGNIAPVGENKIGVYVRDGLYDALTKFLGVDYRAELFRRFADIKTGFAKIGTGFKDLGKALGLGKAKDLATGIFDFLKNALILGFSVVGFASFLQGWNDAEKWFGDNPDFGERISSALAKVLKNFGFIEDEGSTALKINDKVKEIQKIVSDEVEAMKKVAKEITPEISKSFQGLKMAIMGAQRGEPGTLIGGLTTLADGIFGITKELIFGESLLGNIAGIIIMFKVFKAFIAVAGAVKTIGAGVLTALGAVGGLAGFTAVGGALLVATGIVSAIVGIFAGIAAHDDAVKRAKDAFEQSDKSFASKLLSYATYVDEIVRQAGNAIVEGLTGGYITGEDMDRYNKITNEYIKKVYDKIAGIVGDAFNGFLNFIGLGDPDEMAKAAEKKKIAQIDIDKSGTINSYDELNQAIALNEEMSYGERTRARLASEKARAEGMGFQQFIQTSNNPVYNNIVTSFGTNAGSSNEVVL